MRRECCWMMSVRRRSWSWKLGDSASNCAAWLMALRGLRISWAMLAVSRKCQGRLVIRCGRALEAGHDFNAAHVIAEGQTADAGVDLPLAQALAQLRCQPVHLHATDHRLAQHLRRRFIGQQDLMVV